MKRTKKRRSKRGKDDLTEHERAVLAKIDHDLKTGAVELKPLDASLLRSIEELVAGVEVDLDAPIEGPVDLYDPMAATVLPPSKTKH